MKLLVGCFIVLCGFGCFTVIAMYCWSATIKITMDIEGSEDIEISMENIRDKRRRHLEAACEKMDIKPDTNVSRYWSMDPLLRPRLLFSDEYKLLICEIPKCGSSEWRKALLVLEGDLSGISPNKFGHGDTYTIAMKRRFLWDRFPPSDPNSLQELQHRLNTYYRIITVREPLERVVSAYVDKLSSNKSSTQYIFISKSIHKGVGGRGDRLATWEEFVELVSRSPKELMDIHWRPYDTICDPCNIQYDYIAKLETIVEDTKYITDKFGIDTNLLFTDRKNTTDLQQKWEKYAKYYEKLSKEKLRKLYNIHKDQYELFDYPPPPFVT